MPKVSKKKRFHSRCNAERVRDLIIAHLSDLGQIFVLGSLGRREEMVHDLDLLLPGSTADQVKDVLGKRSYGTNPVRIIVEGVLVEIWTCPLEKAGAYALYLQGPLDRNREMRKTARSLGMKWSREGLFRDGILVTDDAEKILFFLKTPLHGKNRDYDIFQEVI